GGAARRRGLTARLGHVRALWAPDACRLSSPPALRLHGPEAVVRRAPMCPSRRPLNRSLRAASLFRRHGARAARDLRRGAGAAPAGAPTTGNLPSAAGESRPLCCHLGPAPLRTRRSGLPSCGWLSLT